MTCRTTRLGSAMTSYVKIVEGIEEHQSLSMYHEIMRDAPVNVAFSRAEQAAFVDGMIAKVQTSPNLTQARKRSLLARLAEAREADLPAGVFYATQRIEDRSRRAKVALDDYYADTARTLGESVSSVRNRLAASCEESRRERSLEAPGEWKSEFSQRAGCASLPMDRHTAYAMWRIDNEIAQRSGAVTTRPAVTSHARVHGTGLSSVGYDETTGRLEVTFRSRQDVYHAYRDVPAEVAAQIRSSDRPTATFNDLVRGRPEYAYASAEDAQAAAVVRQCGSCGQFAGADHGCPPHGSPEEVAATVERARIQQRVVRARANVASGTEDERIAGYQRLGLDARNAALRVEEENRLAEMSPDTTLRHRQNQRLAARMQPYHGDSGTFRCTALSTVRRIAEEEPQVNVPVVAAIDRVYDEETGQPVSVPMGTVSGRVLVRAEDGGYTVTAAEAPGDSGEDTLKCTCVDYRRTYDCVHVRQVVGDITRRINQEYLRDRHAIADAVAAAHAEASAQHEASLNTQQVAQRDWVAGADGVTYAGEEGAVVFQSDYREAQAKIAAGEHPIEYVYENATDGLGAPGTGRGFGLELEFVFPDNMGYHDREVALSLIARDLFEEGLVESEYQEEYGTSRRRGYRTEHQGGWSFEEDGSVDGEIVSPIMHDTPETWQNVQIVCDIVRRHGGVADERVGSHVHVDTSNYDHTVENHNRLLGMLNAHEDELYRLGSQPERGAHRTTVDSGYAAPNRPVPAAGYRSINESVRANLGYVAVNMEDTRHGNQGDHVEMRLWDGTLDHRVLQQQIKMSLAMTEAAFRDTDYQPTGHRPLGQTRTRHREEHGDQRRLTGEQWRASTESTRALIDRMFRRHEDKQAMTALFAMTRWQRPAGSGRGRRR